VVDGVSLEN